MTKFNNLKVERVKSNLKYTESKLVKKGIMFIVGVSTDLTVDIAVDSRSTLGGHSVDSRSIVGIDSRSRCV